MAQSSRPWSGTSTGDAGPYTDTQWREIFRYCHQHGTDGNLSVLHDVLNALEVGASSPAAKSVDVDTGSAMALGGYYNASAAVTLTINDNSSGQDRIDLVVLEIDYSAQTIRLAVKDGTPAGSPVAPSPTQTAGTLWQLPLAEVDADNGFSSIAAGDIRDRREFANLPPYAAASLENGAAAALDIGDAVKLDTGEDSAVDTTTTESDPRIVGALVQGNVDGETVRLAQMGKVSLYVDGAVSRGDLLAAASSAGQVTGAVPGAFAQALEAAGGAGLIPALLLNRPVPNYASYVRTSGSYTTASVSVVQVDATNMELTIVTRGGPVLVQFAGTILNNTYTSNTYMYVYVDGVVYGAALATVDSPRAGGAYMNASFSVLVTGKAAGSHTFSLRWAVSGGTATMYGTGGFAAAFSAIEL